MASCFPTAPPFDVLSTFLLSNSPECMRPRRMIGDVLAVAAERYDPEADEDDGERVRISTRLFWYLASMANALC